MAQIFTEKYVAISREDVVAWIRKSYLDDKDVVEKIRVNDLPKWAHFTLQEK